MQTKNANTGFIPLEGKRPVILEIQDNRSKQMVQTTIYVEFNDPRTNEEIRKQFKQGRKAQIQDKRNFNKAAKLANFNKTFGLPTSHGLTGRGEIIIPDTKPNLEGSDAIRNLFK
jgi:hypothetical protein